jgi:small multidrug resistance pump
VHHWLYLAAAILFEVAGITSMKLAQGFTRPLPSVLIFVFYAPRLCRAHPYVKEDGHQCRLFHLVGGGHRAHSSIGFFWFQEPVTPVRLACIALIVIGIVGRMQ